MSDNNNQDKKEQTEQDKESNPTHEHQNGKVDQGHKGAEPKR